MILKELWNVVNQKNCMILIEMEQYGNNFDVEFEPEDVTLEMLELPVVSVTGNIDMGVCITLTNKKENKENKTVNIKYFEGAKPLVDLDKGDWIDLACREDVTMKKGEYKIIKLGVAMKMPKGCTAYMLPRSSTFGKYGILMANSMGVIDNSYCGDNDEWGFVAYASRDTEIKAGTRLAQFCIAGSPAKLSFKEVEHLSAENRGGFGSTGN